jgi:hypothetical protein
MLRIIRFRRFGGNQMKQTIKMASIVLSIILLVGGCTYISKSLGSKEQNESNRARAEDAKKTTTMVREELTAKADEPKNWTEYARLKNGVVCFLDKGAIVFPEKDKVKVWRKRAFPPRSGEKEIVTYDEIDCRKQSYRSLLIRVTHENDTVETFVKNSPWTKIFEESPEEYMLGAPCIEAGKAGR